MKDRLLSGGGGVMQFCLVAMVTAGQDLIKSVILSLLEEGKVLTEAPAVEAAVHQGWTDIPNGYLRVCSADP